MAAVEQGRGEGELLALLQAVAVLTDQQQHLSLSATQQQRVACLLKFGRLRGPVPPEGSCRSRPPNLHPLAAATSPVAPYAAAVADALPGAGRGAGGCDVADAVARKLRSLLPVAPSAAAVQDLTGEDLRVTSRVRVAPASACTFALMPAG